MDRKKRKLLKNILKELAEDEALSNVNDVSKYYFRLKKVYTDKNGELLRHFYSDIFPVLTKLKQDEKNVIQVGQNLETIYKHSLELNDIEFSSSLRKLWDHTNLEIARIEYITLMDSRMNSTDKELKEQYNNIKKQADEIVNKQDEINSTVEDMNRTIKRVKGIYSEFVSILGIFSAIVLVYFGGTSILGNVINTLKENYILKSILICLIVGMIIFNIIFMFLYFLSKLLDISISAINYSVEYFGILERFKLRYPIVYYTNIFCIFAIIIDIAVWISIGIYNNPNILNDIYLFVDNNLQNVKVLIIFIMIMFNVCFLIYYLFCKITNKLLGSYIVLEYTKKYEIINDIDKYQLIDKGGQVYKSYNKYYKARISLFFRNYIFGWISTIKNLLKRIFFRHKIFITVNIILFILYIFL